MNKRKDNLFSIFKGMGIILMVIGHSGCPNKVFNFIYMFHMALFYWVSGYFFNEKYLNSPLVFIKQRIKGLYLPFVGYSLLFLLLHNLFFKLNIYNDSYGWNGNVSSMYTMSDHLERVKLIILYFSGSEQLLGAFWFLRSLFICNILFFMFSFLSKWLLPRKSIYILSVLVLGSFITGFMLKSLNIELPLNMGRELIIVSLLYLGYLFRKIEIVRYFKNLYALIIPLILISVISINYQISINTGSFGNPGIFLLCSLFGCIMVIATAYFLDKTKANKLLIYIGNNTMTVLVYHFISFKLVSYLIIELNNLEIERLATFPVMKDFSGVWFIYSIIGVAVPVGAKYLFNKYVWRKISLGYGILIRKYE